MTTVKDLFSYIYTIHTVNTSYHCLSLCSPEAKRVSTLKHMVCAKCLLYIDECEFLSDLNFSINIFSCLSNAEISPAGLSVYLKSRFFPAIFTQTPGRIYK